jgi:chitin disaccharide deacetylase
MARTAIHGPLRRLIVNADDFGQSAGVNEGIIQCHRLGIVTSASLMVRWPSAYEAAGYARLEPDLSVGLHVDLGEWVYGEGAWRPIYEVVDAKDPQAVRAEVACQLQTFHRLMDREPTHVDSHQHVHHDGAVRAVVFEIANRLGIPVRGADPRIVYRGEFYGQTAKGAPLGAAITVDSLSGILAGLPNGTSEIGCHPGIGRDAPGMYVAERQQEVAVLCDPRVRATVDAESIALISYHDLDGGSCGA